ncbi:MAG: DUF5615 family PIN-like protein [Solirubrobacterales bacterium]|nr:DUF5615 family PIN-like protein [Solirubrobacterales bacterium]
MKFPVDAQMPARLAELLKRAGHDAMHTSELPNGNRSTDAEIVQVADAQDRVVVTKDRDFRDGHVLHGSPATVARRCHGKHHERGAPVALSSAPRRDRLRPRRGRLRRADSGCLGARPTQPRNG